MSGLRIHHPTLRSAVLLVPHPGNAAGRKPKDYRIAVDSDGNAFVSERVWKRLCEARDSGLSLHEFVVLNEVTDPPAIIVNGQRETRPMYRQNVDEIAQSFAPPGTHIRIKEG